MANLDKPHGFRAVSGPCRAREYKVDAAAASIGVGDIVVLETDGFVARAGASPSQVVGVAQSPHTTGSAGTILVNDHPDTVYEAQTDASAGGGGSDINAESANFANANLVDGAPVNGHSIQEIDQDTGAALATLPLKILRLYKGINNEYGNYNRFECILNTHIYKSVGTAGLA